MRVALVHEWLVTPGGSEAVVQALMAPFPQAPIYTLLHDARRFADTPFASRSIHTSFLQRLPWSLRKHRLYLPLMPLAVEQFDLRAFDLVISSNHAVAKGVLTHSEQLHLSYVHTPMRYAWDLHHAYLEEHGLRRGLRSAAARAILHYLRLWDLAAANRVNHFIANSRYIARRIAKVYRRRATVIHPPVEVDAFAPARQREDFYLTVGRLVGYKRVPMIAEAFARMGRPLVIIGDGPEAAAVRKHLGTHTRWLGECSREQVADHMARCRAFVFAADEDFGIAPVEAQAAGAPVIAFGRGGVTETVVDGQTGLFYEQQTPASLMDAVERFERCRGQFSSDQIAQHARQFSRERFDRQMSQLVDQQWQRFRKGGRS